jgi:hypothetical protein
MRFVSRLLTSQLNKFIDFYADTCISESFVELVNAFTHGFITKFFDVLVTELTTIVRINCLENLSRNSLSFQMVFTHKQFMVSNCNEFLSLNPSVLEPNLEIKETNLTLDVALILCHLVNRNNFSLAIFGSQRVKEVFHFFARDGVFFFSVCTRPKGFKHFVGLVSIKVVFEQNKVSDYIFIKLFDLLDLTL